MKTVSADQTELLFHFHFIIQSDAVCGDVADTSFLFASVSVNAEAVAEKLVSSFYLCVCVSLPELFGPIHSSGEEQHT